MTAYDNVGSLKPHRNPGGLGFGLACLVVGIGIGLVLPRIWNRFKGTPQAATAPATPRPKPVDTLKITAQPEQRGLLITAPVPIKMLKSSETGRAKQQGNAMFTGFKNWGGTTNYLVNGEGDLMLKASDGTSTKWARPDYKGLLEKKPLTAKIAVGKTYTLFFQRRGRRTVDLGTFSVGTGVAAPQSEEASEVEDTPEEEEAPASEDENIVDDSAAPGDLHDTSELDAENAPAENVPEEQKVIR